MKKSLSLFAGLWFSCLLMAQTPLFYESFDKCKDEPDENYGYTGGNDGQWGGDIAKAIVIYDDQKDASNAWSYNNANGAYQCIKVGIAKYAGSATTPQITHTGDAVLTFKVAPWEGDSMMYVTINGGVALDDTQFTLPKKKWTTATIRIADIKGSLQITFHTYLKQRFFLDEVKVMPADPNAGVIRTTEGMSLDFGTLGQGYSGVKKTLHVQGANLSADGISVSVEGTNKSLFSVSTSNLSATGGELVVSLQNGVSDGDYGCVINLAGKDKNTNADVKRQVSVFCSIMPFALQGSGTKTDPFTCADVILLADRRDVFWGGRFWVEGFVLGGAGRDTGGSFTGVSMTNNQGLVLADDATETNKIHFVTVQINYNARAALNVVDNPELVGKPVKVYGDLQNDKGSPLYLGIPGVRNVNNDDQYVRPWDDETALANDPMRKCESTKILRDGQLFILHGEKIYTVTGQVVK
ncbi:MAG: hypothetical protein J5884_02570 [Paludibacteraceae bacterium]|nr:hypothetical protein [Paludibacteraceae bacterium]